MQRQQLQTRKLIACQSLAPAWFSRQQWLLACIAAAAYPRPHAKCRGVPSAHAVNCKPRPSVLVLPTALFLPLATSPCPANPPWQVSDPEEQRFTSYQEVKVQEKMQCLDMGSTPSTLSVLLLHELADSIKPGGEQLGYYCFLVPHNDQG